MLEAFLLLSACVPLVIWQGYRHFASSPEDLRTDEFQSLYKGQDRFPGSKASNDELRSRISAAGGDLSNTMKVMHTAQAVDFKPASSAEDLLVALSRNGFQVSEVNTTGQLEFTAAYKLSSMVFDKKTAELNDFLFEHGWQYNGWSCPATNGDNSDES